MEPNGTPSSPAFDTTFPEDKDPSPLNDE